MRFFDELEIVLNVFADLSSVSNPIFNIEKPFRRLIDKMSWNAMT
jgi:hypothetical protein